MGYTGGASANPTYHALGDHSETVEIDYDTSLVSYSDLLEIFWISHNPASRSWSKQYRAAIFYHGEEQKRLALGSRKALESRIGKVYTEVLPASTFYRAEDYHQKYYLRQRPDLLRVLRDINHGDKDWVDSTAAARINGHLAGNGSCAVTQSELGDILPPDKGRQLSEILCPPE